MVKDMNVRPRRSFIFTPGLRPEMFPKALASGTDIVCVELEDGIAPKLDHLVKIACQIKFCFSSYG